MKFLWLVIIAIASCKAAAVNGLVKPTGKQAQHVIEIRFLDRVAACSDLISTLQKNGFNPQIQ